MHDAIFESFLMRQLEEAERLTAGSDLLKVYPLGPQLYELRFCCKGLVMDAAGTPRIHDEFGVGLFLPADYVRVARHSADIVTWLGPDNVWHPNIKPPFVCTGAIAPGESLTDLAYRLYEIISFHRVSPHDALNPAASQWVRHHQHLLPLDRRTLFRPKYDVVVEDLTDER